MIGVGIVLVVVGVVVCQAVTAARLVGQGISRKRTPPWAPRRHLFDRSETIRVRGGGIAGRRYATWPLATLTFDREVAEVALGRTVSIDRDETTCVRLVRGALATGLTFQSATQDFDGVVFWTVRARRVLGRLQELGWPID